jgi:hypothetical protein
MPKGKRLARRVLPRQLERDGSTAGGRAMDMFNYVMVLASIIIGLGMTHLLYGIAQFAQHPDREKPYWVHLVWVAGAFFQAIFWWWWEFRLSANTSWTFGLYLFVLLYAFIIYLRCALLFPSDLEGYDGYRGYFYSRRGWLFGTALAQVFVDLGDTLFKGWAHFASLGLGYPIASATMIVLFTIAAITRSERYHGALAVLIVTYQLYIALSYYGTMQ